VQLIVEGIVGTAVFVRCFVDRQRLLEQVMDKLGNGFTRAPFASVVV
jgi:palmitoyltransferase